MRSVLRLVASVFLCAAILLPMSSYARQANSSIGVQPVPRKVNPRIALLKSFVVPGWGHHHVDRNNWRRGQFHLGAEIGLVLAYVGLNRYSNSLENDMFSFARAHSGTDIESRNRQFQLAVGRFNSLEEYNDEMLRTRNWDQLLSAESPANRWVWDSEANRLEYLDIRGRRDRIDNQLPGIVTLMVANRIFSGISAFRAARKKNDTMPAVSMNRVPFGNRQVTTFNLVFPL